MDDDQRALLRSIAIEVVNSFSGLMPIVAIGVVGHADTALRVPVSERAKKEMEVSVQRAEAATKDLKAEIDRQANLQSVTVVIAFSDPVGMGATKKLVSNALTEEQMKQNRRVEIFYGQCTVPREWTWTDSAERGQALVKPDTDAHKRILCMLGKLLSIPDVQDGYFNYQDFKSVFFPPGSTDKQKEEILNSHINHLKKDLEKRGDFGPASEIPDALFIKNLETKDAVILSSIQDFNFASHQAGASEVIIRAWRVMNGARAEPKSIYSCYSSGWQP
jgi:hypothetical protein